MDEALKRELDTVVNEYVKAEEAYSKLLMTYVTSNGEPLRVITTDVLLQMQDLEKAKDQAEERMLEVVKRVRSS